MSLSKNNKHKKSESLINWQKERTPCFFNSSKYIWSLQTSFQFHPSNRSLHFQFISSHISLSSSLSCGSIFIFFYQKTNIFNLKEKREKHYYTGPITTTIEKTRSQQQQPWQKKRQTNFSIQFLISSTRRIPIENNKKS